MAVKSATEIKTDINDVDPTTSLVTWDEVKNILTDIVDSLYGGGGGLVMMSDNTELASLTAGDHAVAHSLDITVFKVIVFNSTGTTVYEPNFTITDSNNLTIHWVSDTLSSPSIYYLATS